MTKLLGTKLRAAARHGSLIGWAPKAANAMCNAAELRLGRSFLRSRPLGMDLVSTRRCNLNCIMCVRYKSRPPIEMTEDIFDSIRRQLFRKLLYVRFCSGGEHLLNPAFPAMLEACKRAECLVSIVTNGMLVDEAWTRALVREHPVWSISFSFDGAREKTVESIRRGVVYSNVLENIRRLLCERSKNGAGLPFISFRYTLMRRNIEELPEFVEIAGKMGVDTIFCGYLCTPKGMDESESLWNHKELTERCFEEARRKSAEYRIALDLPGPMRGSNQSRTRTRCTLPWTQISIDPNGDVRLCCNAWDDEGVMGNIAEQDFDTIWNGKRYQEIRATVNSDRPLYPRCRNCPALANDPADPGLHFCDYAFG